VDRLRLLGERDVERLRVAIVSSPDRRCSDLVSLLADYVEHQLPREVHEDLERHLARCPRCVAQLKTYESTMSLLRSIKDDDLPSELRCTLRAFVEKGCKN
jgi:anti-sigma factor RsiW